MPVRIGIIGVGVMGGEQARYQVSPRIDTGTQMVTKQNAAKFTTFQ